MSSSSTTSVTSSTTTTTTTITFEPGSQYGFFFDQSRCTACMVCVSACKSWFNLPPGSLRPLHFFEYEQGTFPNVYMRYQWVPCYHCANPVCVTNSSTHGVIKEGKYGAVLIDPTKATTLRDAAHACPYGAISFESDALDAKAVKCTMCIDRLDQGLFPLCVAACPLRALDFGKLTDLKTKYGSTNTLPDLPDPSQTTPSIVFKPRAMHTQVVPYDSTEALKLLGSRGGSSYPAVYTDPSIVTANADKIVAKNKLVLKPAGMQQLVNATISDEG